MSSSPGPIRQPSIEASATPRAPRLKFIRDALERQEKAGLYRRLTPRPEWADRAWINLCSNDYLGLSQDPRVLAGATAAVSRWGAGAGSARLIAGELGCYTELEEALADFLGFERALIFNSGYHANLGVLSALPGRGGAVFSDALNHASMIDGCRLGRATTSIYEHRDLEHLNRLLEAAPPGPRLVASESLFSMDGDVAPIGELRALSERHDAILVVDDAHALGVMGPEGRGLAWAGARGGGADIVVGTFGKALGAAGAFVAGPSEVREALINLARTFIFTTGPSPAAVGAARAALEILKTDPEPRQRLDENIRFFRAGLAAAGISTGASEGPIVPVVLGSAERTLLGAEKLMARGIFVRGIRPPTVPPGTGRLRLTLSAAHRREQLEQALGVLVEVLAALPEDEQRVGG